MEDAEDPDNTIVRLKAKTDGTGRRKYDTVADPVL